jgi:hypothetical protein
VDDCEQVIRPCRRRSGNASSKLSRSFCNRRKLKLWNTAVMVFFTFGPLKT